MKRKIWLVAPIGAVLLGVAIYLFSGRLQPTGDVRQAKPFAVKDRSGNLRRLSDFAGKTILLHFWATWCPPCRAEIPEILTFARRIRHPNFRLVMISLDPSWADADKTLPKKPLPKNTLSLLDPETKSSEVYGSFQFPETYLIDGAGRIQAKWIGPQDWTHSFFQEQVSKFASQ